MDKPEAKTNDDNLPRKAADSYREYARKMELFENGPTTTHFEQLTKAGIGLPEPETISDADLRAKLWEVLAGLAPLRCFLDRTDHLSDRELYARLWRDVLRRDVPAIDEIGFNQHVELSRGEMDTDDRVYLRFYADERYRDMSRADDPHEAIPPHEDPPFNRDCLLPGPDYEQGQEARNWLRANFNEHGFASNRFATTSDALTFVEQVYAAGASAVWVDHFVWKPSDNWAPYADTLFVDLPKDAAQRHAVAELAEHVGRPDEYGEATPTDSGQTSVRLWWD